MFIQSGVFLKTENFLWLKFVQRDGITNSAYFKQVKKDLRLFSEGNNILRCKGRLSNEPILLPRANF